MREDMAKVIVERERRGGEYGAAGKRREARELAQEVARVREPMRPRGRHRKELNENLAPLYGWLDRQVGRPWNKVYSEMRGQVDVRSAVQLHIMQHVMGRGGGSGHVKLHVEIGEDKKVYEPTSWHRGPRPELYHGALYVHPKTGILHRYTRDRRAERAALRRVDPHLVCVSKDKVYRLGRSTGAWYELRLLPLPATIVYDPPARIPRVEHVTDAWLKEDVRLTLTTFRKVAVLPNKDCAEAYGDGTMYCKSYRQLSSKEIRRLGLRTRQAA